jgi:hypothetical protein
MVLAGPMPLLAKFYPNLGKKVFRGRWGRRDAI